MIRLTFLIFLLLAFEWPVWAQALVKQADRQFDGLAYTEAITLYEKVLTHSEELSAGTRQAVRAKLGYSYRQIRDSQNAERIYRDLAEQQELPPEYAKCYLFYAQALASNGKYQEAQKVYEKYNEVQTADRRSANFSKLYRDVSVLSRNAGTYKVDFLDINSHQADFSPVYYKQGLVFVSARADQGGIKRVFKWNNTPFLDLFYLPELSTLRGGTTASLGSSGTARKRIKRWVNRLLGADAYTAPTANDTRLVGFYGNDPVNGNLAYEGRPLTESDRFSKTLNTKYHEGPATFTKDGSRVIFTRNNYNNGKYRESADGINKLKLYTASQINGTWQHVEELSVNNNDYSTGHPALSKDDRLLFFASDMPGGFGGTDLYICRWTGTRWSKPINLGATINTNGNEMFPFVDEKGNLYFSSDGHAGLGDLDIFFAQLGEDGLPVAHSQNVGEPINSSKDDFGLVTDGERNTGYFSSNRKNGGTDDDIYRFTRQGSLYACNELTISVFDAVSRLPLENVAVNIDNKNIPNDKKQLKTDSNGNVRFCLDKESDFMFLTSREKYLTNRVGFSTRGLSDDRPSLLEISLTKSDSNDQPTAMSVLRGRVTMQKNRSAVAAVQVMLTSDCDHITQQTLTKADGLYEFKIDPGCGYRLEAIKQNMGSMGSHINRGETGSGDLTMFRKGDIIKVDNIYYELNKFEVRPEAQAELNKLAELMLKYPRMQIELRSHTDSRATAQYNKVLSTNRARAAMAYLRTKGIDAKRLVATGYGESLPINKCVEGVVCTEEEYQQNRRTEIRILTVE